MITETRESARGNQPVTNEVTNQLPKRWSDDPWCNMTTGEADAYRRGWEAAKARAVNLCVTEASEFRRDQMRDAMDACQTCALVIAHMEPPK